MAEEYACVPFSVRDERISGKVYVDKEGSTVVPAHDGDIKIEVNHVPWSEGIQGKCFAVSPSAHRGEAIITICCRKCELAENQEPGCVTVTVKLFANNTWEDIDEIVKCCPKTG